MLEVVVALFIFATIPLHQTGVEGVQITSIKVPNSVDNGNGNATVILDCEYSLLEHEKQGLVVQWWFVNDANGSKEIIYQWIPGVRPQVSGIFRDRVNLEFRISDDIYHRHRAIQVMKLSNDLSGDYLCKVSTFDNEDTAQAKMVVYVPPRSFTIETKMSMSAVNISCDVKGVHPTPDLQLIQEESPSGKRTILQATTSKTSSRDGLFDSTVYLEMEDIPDVAVQFECQLSIPGTEYLVSQKIFYDPSLEVTSTLSPRDNGIDDEEDYDHLDSASSSMPSTYAPSRRSQDLGISRQMLTNEDINADSLSSTGRGIRAPESSENITDNGASLNGLSSDRILNFILVAVLVQLFFY